MISEQLFISSARVENCQVEECEKVVMSHRSFAGDTSGPEAEVSAPNRLLKFNQMWPPRANNVIMPTSGQHVIYQRRKILRV